MAAATVPTKAEIKTLPRWARVAFAARCARRVLPVYTTNKHATPKGIKAVRHAVELAEQSGAYAAYAYAAAADAAARRAGRIAPIGAIRGDFELLAALAKAEAWTDATPVPPAVFGPLWPDGPPKDWPIDPAAVADAAQEFTVELEFPDDATDEQMVAAAKELALKLDRVHVAYGGHGLEIRGIKAESPALVPAGGGA